VEAATLRNVILERSRVTEIVRLPDSVFRDATVNTVLLFVAREEDEDRRLAHEAEVFLFDVAERLTSVDRNSAEQRRFAQSLWIEGESQMFSIGSTDSERELLGKLQALPRMADLCDFSVGIQAYDSHTGQDRGLIDRRAYHADHQQDATYLRELNGSDVSRYGYHWPGDTWVSYGDWLAHPRRREFFDGPRILVREITGRGTHQIHATFLTEDFVNYKSILNVLLNGGSRSAGYNERYFLGLLNSRVLSWYFPRASNKLVTRTFPRISILDLKRFPIRTLDLADPAETARHDRMVALVEQMLELHERAATTAHDRQLLRRQIETTDQQIDRLVHELYGLTEEEVAIIESVTSQ
jgi:hypothetical protein